MSGGTGFTVPPLCFSAVKVLLVRGLLFAVFLPQYGVNALRVFVKRNFFRVGKMQAYNSAFYRVICNELSVSNPHKQWLCWLRFRVGKGLSLVPL